MKRTLVLLVTLITMGVMMAQPGGGMPPMGGKGPKDGEAMPKPEKGTKLKKQKVQYVSDIVDAHGMYVYGIAYSPVDSVIYMTDQMMLEGAQIHLRTKFLVARDELSSQLRNHMIFEGEKNRTCCVIYNKDIKALNKEFSKQEAYYKKKGFTVKHIDQSRFTFKAVRTEYNENGYAVEEKEVMVEE